MCLRERERERTSAAKADAAGNDGSKLSGTKVKQTHLFIPNLEGADAANKAAEFAKVAAVASEAKAGS